MDVSHEGNIICVAKLDKYRAIASEPFRLQIASKFKNGTYILSPRLRKPIFGEHFEMSILLVRYNLRYIGVVYVIYQHS